MIFYENYDTAIFVYRIKLKKIGNTIIYFYYCSLPVLWFTYMSNFQWTLGKVLFKKCERFSDKSHGKYFLSKSIEMQSNKLINKSINQIKSSINLS